MNENENEYFAAYIPANQYFAAKIGFDTAENELSKVLPTKNVLEQLLP